MRIFSVSHNLCPVKVTLSVSSPVSFLQALVNQATSSIRHTPNMGISWWDRWANSLMPANSPDLSPLWQVLRHHSALVSPAFFLTFQNTVCPGKTEMKQKEFFFRDLSFFLLPSSRHQALPTARCHCAGGVFSLGHSWPPYSQTQSIP